MAPSLAWKPTSAVVDSGPKGVGMGVPTPGFQPVMVPLSVAKRNTDAPVLVPSVTEKSVELPVPIIGWLMLNTWPVGLPPGMVTLKGWLIALPLTSPRYSSLRPDLLDETQNAPEVGAAEMPHALTRVGSRFNATPTWSETRLICWNRPEADGRLRSSSRSSTSRARAGFRAGVPLRRLPPSSFDTRLKPVMRKNSCLRKTS